MRIVHVTEACDLQALFRFRYEIFVERLCWLPENPSLLLSDEYDEAAFNYAAVDNCGAVVGSVRVVPDGPLGLPLEHCFPLDGLRDGRHLVEICRLAVAEDLRCSHLAGLLMKAAYQCSVAIGASHITLDTYVGYDSAGALYERMGFERIAGPYRDPEYCCDLPVVSFWLDVERARREWPTQRPGLYRFFTTPDQAIDHG